MADFQPKSVSAVAKAAAQYAIKCGAPGKTSSAKRQKRKAAPSDGSDASDAMLMTGIGLNLGKVVLHLT